MIGHATAVYYESAHGKFTLCRIAWVQRFTKLKSHRNFSLPFLGMRQWHFHDDWACDSSLLCTRQWKVQVMHNSVNAGYYRPVGHLVVFWFGTQSTKYCPREFQRIWYKRSLVFTRCTAWTQLGELLTCLRSPPSYSSAERNLVAASTMPDEFTPPNSVTYTILPFLTAAAVHMSRPIAFLVLVHNPWFVTFLYLICGDNHCH